MGLYTQVSTFAHNLYEVSEFNSVIFLDAQLVGDASQRNIPEQVRVSRCSDITEIFIETSFMVDFRIT